jgi:hypothetical protein
LTIAAQSKSNFLLFFSNIEADLVKLSSASVLTPMQELGVNKSLRLIISNRTEQNFL